MRTSGFLGRRHTWMAAYQPQGKHRSSDAPWNRASPGGVVHGMAGSSMVKSAAWVLCCVPLACQSQGTPALAARQPQAATVGVPVQVLPAPLAVALAPSDAAAGLASAPEDRDADAGVVAKMPWPLSELPLCDEEYLGTFGPRVGGFSNDDRYLGYEISTCDPCPSEFTFVSPRAPAISMSYFYAPQLDSSISGRSTTRP